MPSKKKKKKDFDFIEQTVIIVLQLSNILHLKSVENIKMCNICLQYVNAR